ncbi:hypothetical protein F7D01_12825 [Erythrobacter sp. 3-20A1M]|uniref:DUF2231 domain-containing protein n=1 Tax=Erythrobacter sp. 3-20A1M TaxID=2653850 RepID=UPI001BFC370B|nr:DUF2231 domain-containing protein [Erythrobacter sp. 3-20A1M]QWC57837.1 hypothetical protein F7D01_12825 [Erythrobacter sp. 3-20A1M]
MKPVHLLTLLCAAMLSVSPAQAHGDEDHGNAASTPAASAPKQDNHDVMEAQPASGQAEEGHGAAGHDEAAGGHDEAGEGGFVAVLKKLHPATIHFPIALFLMAALTELFVIARRGAGLEPAVRVMIYGGAAGAVVAALFGWIHTGIWFGGDTVMQVHRWNGTLLAALGLVLAVLASGQRDSRAPLRVLLFTMAILLLGQGFLGGELAHGPDHLGLSWI